MEHTIICKTMHDGTFRTGCATSDCNMHETSMTSAIDAHVRDMRLHNEMSATDTYRVEFAR